MEISKNNLKRAFLKIILLAVLSLILIISLLVLSAYPKVSLQIARITKSQEYVDKGSEEVIPRLERVIEKNETTSLIVGDSVANQIFDDLHDDSDEFTIATTNQALTLAGQYVLVEEYLTNHPYATDVYICLIPTTFDSEINETYSYQYIVIPFTQTGTIELLDDDTHVKLGHIFGNLFMQKSIVNIVDASGLNQKLYLNYLKERKENGCIENCYWKYDSLSETSSIYIKKLDKLCSDNGVRLHFIAAPLADTVENHEYTMELQKNIDDCGLSEIMSDYMNQIEYYPSYYYRDGIHFANDIATDEFKNSLISKMQSTDNYGKHLPLYG